MKFFHKNSIIEQHKIDAISADFTYITDVNSKVYSCKLINSKHTYGVSIVTDIPLFKNDHILIQYIYNGIEFEYDAIVSKVLQSEKIIKFLAFSESEQNCLDNLIAASLRKRF